jgi:hypothetical protein
VLGWTLLASLGLLSHVSTFATLLVTLSALAVLLWWAGGATRRAPARALLLAMVAAVAIAIGTYYGHFGDVYLKALRVRGGGAPIAAQAQAPPDESPRTDITAEAGARGSGLGARTINSLRLVTESLGWPILLLAGAGAWRLSRQPSRDPLMLALGAWGVASVVFLGVGLMPVEPQFERYSLEFVSRVAYAAGPAAAVLAGAGTAWGWRSGRVGQGVSIVLLALAMAAGIREWTAWFFF